MGRTARTIPVGRYVLRVPKNKEKGRAYPVYLCYYCSGKQLRMSTSICVRLDDWNAVSCTLKASYGRDYRQKNNYLITLKTRVDNDVLEYVQANRTITAPILYQFMNGDSDPNRKDNGILFIDYGLGYLERRYNSRQIRFSTYRNGMCNLNKMGEFLKIRSPVPLFVGDITADVVTDFVKWSVEGKRKAETVRKYLQTISQVCEQASKEGYLPVSVVSGIKDLFISDEYDADESSVRYLTEEELRSLATLQNIQLSRRQRDVLEMFLFAIYACGLRISDIISLRWQDIDLTKRTINKVLVKTRSRNTIPINEQAMMILEKWKGRHKVFVFGLLSDSFDISDGEEFLRRRNALTSTFNKSLKRMAEKAGIDKKVTFHVSRHTWAVLALEKGVEISKISRLLGHSSTMVTEKVYAEFLPDTLSKAVQNLHFDI